MEPKLDDIIGNVRGTAAVYSVTVYTIHFEYLKT